MNGRGGGDPPFVVFVVPHTHWDREWYHPAGVFRQRLVALIDELLDAPAPEPVPFLLDGQAVVLEDYVAVRPERTGELATRLRNATVEAGPWFVLADELIPGGEALVRNLLAGRRTLRAFGAAAPPVLYCPDSFGHPAALPTLANGFGLPLVVVWRGYGGRRWPAGDTAWWAGPDGSRALLFHLPPSGYEFGSDLPAEPGAAADRWRALYQTLAPRSGTGVLLVQNGADHHARQTRHAEAIAALAAAADPIPLRVGGLRELADTLISRAATEMLPVVRGELRDSYGYTWALQGTFATRAHQKRENARTERLLTREAEPWAAVARFRGEAGSGPLLDAAWKALLLCHPHDTLCGCSIDPVAHAMDVRLAEARAQAVAIRDLALERLVGHDAAAARTDPAHWHPVVLVRNPVARARGGVAELELETFLAHAPVGPGSAGIPVSPRAAPAATLDAGRIPIQVLASGTRFSRTESPRHYPDNDLVRVDRVVAWLPPLAGYAVRPIPLDEDSSREPAGPPEGRIVTVDGRGAANGLVRVVIDDGGRVTIAGGASTAEARDILGFEDVSDRGDLYTHSPAGRTRRRTRFDGTRVVHAGPLRGEIEARWTMRVPVGLGQRATTAIPITARFVVDVSAPFVRVAIHGTNSARDHRLRVLLRTGVTDGAVVADAAFGPIARVPLDVPPEDMAGETPPATAPLHRYVSVLGTDSGWTLYSDGLAEYEAMADGTIAVTLVRAVGELSRPDLPERPGHAGWPAPVPDAQCLRPFDATFALYPHGPGGAETTTAVERVADDALLPLTGSTLRSYRGPFAAVGGLTLAGDGLAFSAAKESADGGGIVLRCVNLLDREVDGRWELGTAVSRAWLARLDETRTGPARIAGGAVEFRARPRAVVTIIVDREAT